MYGDAITQCEDDREIGTVAQTAGPGLGMNEAWCQDDIPNKE